MEADRDVAVGLRHCEGRANRASHGGLRKKCWAERDYSFAVTDSAILTSIDKTSAYATARNSHRW